MNEEDEGSFSSPSTGDRTVYVAIDSLQNGVSASPTPSSASSQWHSVQSVREPLQGRAQPSLDPNHPPRESRSQQPTNDGARPSTNIPEEGPAAARTGTSGQPTPASPNPVDVNNIPELRNTWDALKNTLPFVFLLLIKNFYEHSLGISLAMAFFVSAFFANDAIMKQISAKERRRLGVVACIALVLSVNIFLLYYAFSDEKLHRALYLQLPAVQINDMWTLLWVIGITGFVMTFIAMIMKCFVIALPTDIDMFKMRIRGRMYTTIEEVTMFCRQVIPIPAWILYMINDETPEFSNFTAFLIGLYGLLKARHLYTTFQDMSKSLEATWKDDNFGAVPTREELSQAESACPICQEEYRHPIRLSCNHIFCDDCVSTWFDRERTCPMCRTRVPGSCKGRDGNTSLNVQLF